MSKMVSVSWGFETTPSSRTMSDDDDEFCPTDEPQPSTARSARTTVNIKVMNNLERISANAMNPYPGLVQICRKCRIGLRTDSETGVLEEIAIYECGEPSCSNYYTTLRLTAPPEPAPDDTLAADLIRAEEDFDELEFIAIGQHEEITKNKYEIDRLNSELRNANVKISDMEKKMDNLKEKKRMFEATAKKATGIYQDVYHKLYKVHGMQEALAGEVLELREKLKNYVI